MKPWLAETREWAGKKWALARRLPGRLQALAARAVCRIRPGHPGCAAGQDPADFAGSPAGNPAGKAGIPLGSLLGNPAGLAAQTPNQAASQPAGQAPGQASGQANGQPANQAARQAAKPVPKEVLRFQPDRVLLERAAPPLGARWTLYSCAALLCFAILWAIFGRIDKIVTSTGKVVTVDTPVVLQAYSTSLIKDVRVNMGQVVRKGEVLVVLDATFAQADMTQLEARISSYAALKERLQCELDGVAYPPEKPAENSGGASAEGAVEGAAGGPGGSTAEGSAEGAGSNAGGKPGEASVTPSPTPSTAPSPTPSPAPSPTPPTVTPGPAAPPPSGTDLREQRLQAGIFRNRQAEYDSRLKTYAEQIKRLEVELDATGRDLVHREERLKIFAEFEEMRRKLYEKGMESKAGYLEVQKDKHAIAGDVLRMESRLQELRHEIASTEADRNAFLTRWHNDTAQELVAVGRELDTAREQFSKAKKMGELVDIRAPMDGVVLEVARRNAGSVANEAEALVTLVPLDAKLEVEIEIQPMDIGFVRVGQEARVKLETMPFQKHGKLDATVIAVSEDAFLKQTPAGEQSVYRARLKLPEEPLAHMRNLPPGFTLLPGMAVTAEINVGDRRIIEYFLYPVLAGFDGSLKEPR